MKKFNFVFVGKDLIKIINHSFNKTIDLVNENIRFLNPKIISSVIIEHIPNFDFENDELILIPSNEFIQCSEKYFSHFKSNLENKDFMQNFSNDIIEVGASSYDFSQQLVYIVGNKTLIDYDKIELNQKYFIRKKQIFLETEFWKEIIANLDEFGIKVSKIMSPGFKFNENNFEQQIDFKIGNQESNISFYKSGFIIDSININLGIENIIKQISEEFNISIGVAKKLLENFGSALLEKKYYNVIIEIPIYKNYTQDISLTDLSFCVRNSLKQIYDNLILKLSKKYKSEIFENSYIFLDSYFNIREMNKFLEVILNKKVLNFDKKTFEFENLLSLLNVFNLNCLYTKENLEKSEKTSNYKEKILLEKPVQNKIHNFVSKFVKTLNSGIQNILIEPEFR
ncbi:MAG: hypothetical protein RBR32_05015 [Bacteroidales bacterium]|nr:hypothetical protein [Bacteroidales bacterium]